MLAVSRQVLGTFCLLEEGGVPELSPEETLPPRDEDVTLEFWGFGTIMQRIVLNLLLSA
jgi:hypothetical protein